jgi:hypothetical protein
MKLGPSALVGFSLFIMMAPVQRLIMGAQFKIRKASVAWTDKRAKLLLEILGSFQVYELVWSCYNLTLADRRDENRQVLYVREAFLTAYVSRTSLAILRFIVKLI